MWRYLLHTTGLRWGFGLGAIASLPLWIGALLSDQVYEKHVAFAEFLSGIVLMVTGFYATVGAVAGWFLESLIRFVRRAQAPLPISPTDAPARPLWRRMTKVALVVLGTYGVAALLVLAIAIPICYARARRPIVCEGCDARFRTWGFSKDARDMLELRRAAFDGSPPHPIRAMVLWEKAEDLKKAGLPSPILCPNCRQQELTLDRYLGHILTNRKRFAM